MKQNFLYPLNEWIGDDLNGDGQVTGDEIKWKDWNKYKPLWRMIATLGLQVCAMVAVLLFPLCARYENRSATHVKNAFLLAIGNLPRVLAIFVIWGIPIAACLLWGSVLYVLSIMWVLFGYAMLSWLNQALLWPIFDKLEA